MVRRKRKLNMDDSFKGSFKSFIIPSIVVTLLIIIAMIFVLNNIG